MALLLSTGTVGTFAAAGALAQVPPVGATADVRDANGRSVASAEFREGHGEVLVTILFANPQTLTGTHGLRIHEAGRCDGPNFTTAGNGFNPLNKKHGRQNPEGPQVGDLPNVNFTNGLTSYNTSAPGATLGQGPTSLLGPNRTALIVYSGEDDQITDPDGKAGNRIACGVIMPGAAAAAVGAPVAAGQAVPTITPFIAAQPGGVQQPGVVARPSITAVTTQPQQQAQLPGVAKPAASPVVGQPPVVAAQPAQQAQGQTQPGQPVVPAVPATATRPAASPVLAGQPQVVAKPVVTTPTPIGVTAPSPVAAAPQVQLPLPTTVPPVTTSASATNSGGLGSLPALAIAVVGVGLAGAGYLLRRRSQLQQQR